MIPGLPESDLPRHPKSWYPVSQEQGLLSWEGFVDISSISTADLCLLKQSGGYIWFNEEHSQI